MVDQIQLPPVQAFSGGADFSPIAKLGDIYRAAQDRRSLADLGQQLSAGTVDYRQAAAPLFAMGNPEAGLRMLGMAEAQRKEQLALQASQAFSGGLAGMVRGNMVPRAGADTPDEVATVPPQIPSQVPPVTAPQPNAVTPPQASIPEPDSTDTDISSRQRTQAQTPSMSMAEGPTVAHIPMLLNALQNPYLPEAQKEIAKDMLKRAWDSAKPTEKIQTLQGLSERPDLLAIEKDLRKSQAPTVNMMPGEKEVDKTLGEMHSNVLKSALNAPAAKSTLDVAERAMSQPGFNSGSNANAVLAAQRAGIALGLVDADKASPNELFQKMSNKAVTDAAGGGGGGLGTGVSNADRDFIRDATFNLQNTPEGNKKVIGVMRLLEDRKIEAAKEMNKYAHDHGGRVDIDVVSHMAQWANDHPLPLDKIFGVRITPVTEGAAPGTATGSHKNIPFTVSP